MYYVYVELVLKIPWNVALCFSFALPYFCISKSIIVLIWHHKGFFFWLIISYIFSRRLSLFYFKILCTLYNRWCLASIFIVWNYQYLSFWLFLLARLCRWTILFSMKNRWRWSSYLRSFFLFLQLYKTYTMLRDYSVEMEIFLN